MPFNVIGYPGAGRPHPRLNFQQPSGGPQAINYVDVVAPVVLQPGQVFVLPAGQWAVASGRYTDLQVYDSTTFRWRNFATQPGQQSLVSSDGQNFRLANTTGTPIGATITNVGAGNATNGYNTVTATPSAGSSTWGTLVGGSVNGVVTVTAGGNFSLPPILVWQPAANQNYPYIPPEFCCNISSNAINTVTVNYHGAGLTGVGTLTAVNQPGDTNPGNAKLTLNASLNNSGNLTAIWPLTQGTEVTALPTFTFNVGGGMCANVIMDWTVSNFSITSAGCANFGVAKTIAIITANGIANDAQNSTLNGTSYSTKLAMPRMAWLTSNSQANGQIANNGNVVIMDAGKNLQAVPILAIIPSNMNGVITNGFPVIAAVVGGQTDTSYIQAF